MAQPPAYNRTKDFTVNFANETDHTALNSEFDAAANSINDIRDNLAILQADDGKLRPSVVTIESISSAVYDGIIARMAGQDISQAVLTNAQEYATTASIKAEEATSQATLAVNAKDMILSTMDTFFDELYPVGSVEISMIQRTFKRGTWELLSEGVVLLSAGGSYLAGTQYGADTHALTEAEIPSHTHTVTASSAGSHTHTRGSMEITGGFSTSTWGANSWGAFTGNSYAGGKPDKSGGAGYNFTASKTWTGETSSNGGHSHTITCASVGEGSAFSLMQKSIAVYIYRRTA